jgi:multiple sugar transport system permease protein
MDVAEAPREEKVTKLSSQKRNNLIKKIFVYAALISLSVVFIFPLLWMISTSFKPENEAMAFPPRLLPRVWDWWNYHDAFDIVPLGRFYMNSLIVAGLGTFGTVVSSSFVAYGFARIKATGRSFWFGLVLATLMLPPQVTMIPVYVIWSRLGFIDSFVPLVLPAFLGNSYYVFLLRQFFRTIPKEIEESAYLDGANTFQIFYKLILPMSRAAIITVTLLQFMALWNDFMGPLIYLQSESRQTLALGITRFQGALTTYWGPMMAASVLMLAPLMVIFFVGQKYFVKGIATTGTKG